MNKFFTYISLSIIMLLAVLAPHLGHGASTIKAATDIYLKTPTYISIISNVDDSLVLLYDESDQGIKAYLLDENNQSTSPISISEQKTNLIDMKSDGTTAYILTKTVDKAIISKVTLDKDNKITLTALEVNTNISEAKKFAYDSNNFYVLLSSDTIECLTLNTETLQLTHQKSITKANISDFPDTILDVAATNIGDTEVLYLLSETELKYIHPDESAPYASELVYTSDTNNLKNMIVTNNDIYLNSSDKIVQIKNSDNTVVNTYTIDTDKHSITNITSFGDTVFFSDKDNHQVLQIDKTTKTQSHAITNYKITPTLYDSKSIKIGRLNKDSLLQIMPYTTSDSKSLEKNTEIIILSEDAEFTNHYFVLLSNNKQNTYGYITKSTVDVVKKSQDDTSLMTFADSTPVYKYPSIYVDEYNSIITNLPKNIQLTRIATLDYTTKDNNSFSEIKLNDGTTGYIENSRLTAPVTAKSKSIEANAKLKSDTNLYSDPEGTHSLIELKAGTRVRVDEKINRNKKYTKITLNLSDGSEVSGYVLTSAINPDYLTPMQILGIVLVAINIVFMALIIAIRKRLTNT